MGWFDKPAAEKKADLDRYKATRKAAEAAARKLRNESAATRQLNDAVRDAAREIPWWRR